MSFSRQKKFKSIFLEYKVLPSCKVWAERNKKCKSNSKDALLGVLDAHHDVHVWHRDLEQNVYWKVTNRLWMVVNRVNLVIFKSIKNWTLDI